MSAAAGHAFVRSTPLTRICAKCGRDVLEHDEAKQLEAYFVASYAAGALAAKVQRIQQTAAQLAAIVEQEPAAIWIELSPMVVAQLLRALPDTFLQLTDQERDRAYFACGELAGLFLRGRS